MRVNQPDAAFDKRSESVECTLLFDMTGSQCSNDFFTLPMLPTGGLRQTPARCSNKDEKVLKIAVLGPPDPTHSAKAGTLGFTQLNHHVPGLQSLVAARTSELL
jgi:hypothetical protein